MGNLDRFRVVRRDDHAHANPTLSNSFSAKPKGMRSRASLPSGQQPDMQRRPRLGDASMFGIQAGAVSTGPYGTAASRSRRLTARNENIQRPPVQCIVEGDSHPLAPMRRFNANSPPGPCIAPAAKDAAARPSERIYAATVDDSQFKVAVERRDGDVVPQAKALSVRQSFPRLRSHAHRHFRLACWSAGVLYKIRNANRSTPKYIGARLTAVACDAFRKAWLLLLF
jgi:hypothetical protein